MWKLAFKYFIRKKIRNIFKISDFSMFSFRFIFVTQKGYVTKIQDGKKEHFFSKMICIIFNKLYFFILHLNTVFTIFSYVIFKKIYIIKIRISLVVFSFRGKNIINSLCIKNKSFKMCFYIQSANLMHWSWAFLLVCMPQLNLWLISF